MIQDLEGIDIYHCTYFNIDSNKNLVFAKGSYVNKCPRDFKTIHEISNIIRYCMWIIKQKGHHDIDGTTKYAAIVYMNKVNERFKMIESEYRKILKETQTKNDKSLKNSIDKPGRTYV
jgi:hypothetical protein